MANSERVAIPQLDTSTFQNSKPFKRQVSKSYEVMKNMAFAEGRAYRRSVHRSQDEAWSKLLENLESMSKS